MPSAITIGATVPHILETSLMVPRPRHEAFRFFSDVENLERITPPELAFEIVTPRPIAIREGARIDYRLRLFGVRLSWRTRITRWRPNDEFVDVQEIGPYKTWVHTHRFRDVPGGTEITDHVAYELPLAPFGDLARPLVRRQLHRIFEYRRRAVTSLLGEAARSGAIEASRTD